MADPGEPLLAQAARLSRRRLIGSVAGGALLGSAWAAALRNAVTAGNDVHITVARTSTALGVLFEHHGHRIMLLDAADGPGAASVTELATGFIRQRIDAVMLTTGVATTLPRDYRERWNVRDVWAIPELGDAGPSSLAGKSLRVGDLTIVSDALPFGAWRVDSPPGTGWHVAASLGRARLTVTRDGGTIARLPLDARMANAVVCNDALLDLDILPPGIDALVAPAEAAGDIPEGTIVVALAPNESTTFRLHEDRIETP